MDDDEGIVDDAVDHPQEEELLSICAHMVVLQTLHVMHGERACSEYDWDESLSDAVQCLGRRLASERSPLLVLVDGVESAAVVIPLWSAINGASRSGGTSSDMVMLISANTELIVDEFERATATDMQRYHIMPLTEDDARLLFAQHLTRKAIRSSLTGIHDGLRLLHSSMEWLKYASHVDASVENDVVTLCSGVPSCVIVLALRVREATSLVEAKNIMKNSLRASAAGWSENREGSRSTSLSIAFDVLLGRSEDNVACMKGILLGVDWDGWFWDFIAIRSRLLSVMYELPPSGFHHRNVAIVACLASARGVTEAAEDFSFERAAAEVELYESLAVLQSAFPQNAFVRAQPLYVQLTRAQLNDSKLLRQFESALEKEMVSLYAREYCSPFSFKWAPDFGLYFYNRVDTLFSSSNKIAANPEHWRFLATHMFARTVGCLLPAQVTCCYQFQYSMFVFACIPMVIAWVMVLSGTHECCRFPLWGAKLIVALQVLCFGGIIGMMLYEIPFMLTIMRFCQLGGVWKEGVFAGLRGLLLLADPFPFNPLWDTWIWFAHSVIGMGYMLSCACGVGALCLALVTYGGWLKRLHPNVSCTMSRGTWFHPEQLRSPGDYFVRTCFVAGNVAWMYQRGYIASNYILLVGVVFLVDLSAKVRRWSYVLMYVLASLDMLLLHADDWMFNADLPAVFYVSTHFPLGSLVVYNSSVDSWILRAIALVLLPFLRGLLNIRFVSPKLDSLVVVTTSMLATRQIIRTFGFGLPAFFLVLRHGIVLAFEFRYEHLSVIAPRGTPVTRPSLVSWWHIVPNICIFIFWLVR
eukprot:TRINITY_DN5989_c0_g1_i2.p1 TRINITY_DN5989_c0_g1~~TRINITY_DN5989_c0_g1_i2.p1  ORF type:complete len:948 (+),score=52.03 TRINITY_DN5989_c0_g1_i2:415-2844(+)